MSFRIQRPFIIELFIGCVRSVEVLQRLSSIGRSSHSWRDKLPIAVQKNSSDLFGEAHVVRCTSARVYQLSGPSDASQ